MSQTIRNKSNKKNIYILILLYECITISIRLHNYHIVVIFIIYGHHLDVDNKIRKSNFKKTFRSRLNGFKVVIIADSCSKKKIFIYIGMK